MPKEPEYVPWWDEEVDQAIIAQREYVGRPYPKIIEKLLGLKALYRTRLVECLDETTGQTRFIPADRAHLVPPSDLLHVPLENLHDLDPADLEGEIPEGKNCGQRYVPVRRRGRPARAAWKKDWLKKHP